MQKNYENTQCGLTKNSEMKKSVGFGAQISITRKDLKTILKRLEKPERSAFLDTIREINKFIKPIELKIKKNILGFNFTKKINPTFELGSEVFAGGTWNLCGKIKEIKKVITYIHDNKWTATKNVFRRQFSPYHEVTENTPPGKALKEVVNTLLEQVNKNSTGIK